MIRKIINDWYPFVVGAVIGVIGWNLWKGEDIDWSLLIFLCLGSLSGIAFKRWVMSKKNN